MVYRTIQQNGEAEMIIKNPASSRTLPAFNQKQTRKPSSLTSKKPITKPITTSQFIYSVTMTTFNAPMMTASPVVQPACPC